MTKRLWNDFFVILNFKLIYQNGSFNENDLSKEIVQQWNHMQVEQKNKDLEAKTKQDQEESKFYLYLN